MILIQSITAGSGGVANFTLSSIPQEFTDLVLLVSLRTTVANTVGTISFNAGGTMERNRLFGDGSSRTADQGTVIDVTSVPSTFTASTFSNGSFYIPNYSGSVTKSYISESVQENNAASSQQVLISGTQLITAAITSITLTPGSGNWAENSTVSLHGIL